MDDMIMGSLDNAERVQHLGEIFQRQKKYSLVCKFGQATVKFLATKFQPQVFLLSLTACRL